jgi:hypothetical protein
MDQEQITLLPTALRWDSNGDLRSEILRCLVDRLQEQDVNSRTQGGALQAGR